MAKKDKINEKNLESLRNQSSLIVNGMETTLDNENNELKSIVHQTIVDTKVKLGERTNGKPINYFNEINFGSAFSQIFVKDGEADKKGVDNNIGLKKFMEESPKVDISSLLMEEGTRTIKFNNYKIIHQHIPECANALAVYKDNIMSPDDYTKLMFNVKYEKSIDEDTKKVIEERLSDISLKYELEDLADSIIEEALLLGESAVAVLSLEDELSYMLSKGNMMAGGILSESVKTTAIKTDETHISLPVLSESINVSSDDVVALKDILCDSDNIITEASAKEIVAKMINDNVQIGSKREFLFERAGAELDAFNKSGVDIDLKLSKKSSKKKEDNKPMFINGSAIRRLAPERLLELKIDNVCYGYYYAEDTGNIIPQSSYLGVSSGRDVKGTMSLAQNNTVSSTSMEKYSPASSAANQLGVGEQKLNLITNLFLSTISKKIDKDFIRNNKQFKDFIYDLVKQNYIVSKGLKLTYFRPDEIIKFECPAVYRDITFFAKLYLSILTNNLLIKLGRSHDKRIFYVNVGADAKYEEAINSVIQDIKTKDYAMESLNDFNTILNLTPGRFDDYFMPTINGDRPVDIDTLPGMDVDMNNEFVEYLKNSMMSGMGVPRNLIDTTSEVDFARSISAMNANFVRSVIRYQKKLTVPFTRMYQKLYKNEYRFNNNAEMEKDLVDITSIKVSFPSPATLAMTNLLDQFQAADQNAEYISSQILPMKSDQSTEDDRIALKAAIIKDLVPGIDWARYEDMKEKILKDKVKEKVSKPTVQDPSMADPYGQY